MNERKGLFLGTLDQKPLMYSGESRGMLGLALCVLLLLQLLGMGYRSIADTLRLSGLGAVSSTAALLLVALLAAGVYSKRDALAAGTGRRKHDIGWLVGVFVVAIVVWVDLFGNSGEGEATLGVLAALLASALVAQFSLTTLLLFAIRSVAVRWREMHPANQSAQGS